MRVLVYINRKRDKFNKVPQRRPCLEADMHTNTLLSLAMPYMPLSMTHSHCDKCVLWDTGTFQECLLKGSPEGECLATAASDNLQYCHVCLQFTLATCWQSGATSATSAISVKGTSFYQAWSEFHVTNADTQGNCCSVGELYESELTCGRLNDYTHCHFGTVNLRTGTRLELERESDDRLKWERERECNQVNAMKMQ